MLLNKEKLIAFAMAKRTKDKVEQESGEQTFNLGQVSYQNKKTSLVTRIRTPKSQYEFLFLQSNQRRETDEKKEAATDSSDQAERKNRKRSLKEREFLANQATLC